MIFYYDFALFFFLLCGGQAYFYIFVFQEKTYKFKKKHKLILYFIQNCEALYNIKVLKSSKFN